MRIKKKTYLLWKKIFFSTILCICVFGIGFVFFRTSFFTITSYELIGVPDENKAALTAEITDIAKVPRYKLLPTNRIYSYRREEIRSRILASLPDTASIGIHPVSLHTLRITVTHYTPAFRIDATHAITTDGIIYPEQHDISNLPVLTIASSTQKITHEDGIEIARIDNLPTDFIPHVQKLISQINSVIFVVGAIRIDGYADVALSNVEGNSSILFSSTQDTNKVWSNLVSAIDTEPLKSKLADTNNTLEYLDTRFGNKVFFKFTNGGKTAIMPAYEATTTATTTLH